MCKHILNAQVSFFKERDDKSISRSDHTIASCRWLGRRSCTLL